MSRRSHRHNRATDDDLYGNWASQDPPSGSHSGYAAGNSYTQHGSYDRGYGGSSYGGQSSYAYSGSHSGGDPNYGHRQQYQYQEQSGGYGSQRAQGYESEDEEIGASRGSIRHARRESLNSAENSPSEPRMAEATSSASTLELLGQGQRSRYTGANDRTAFSSEYASRAGNSYSSQSRAQEEEAMIARQQQLEMEERRAREISRQDQANVSRYRFDDGYGRQDEVDRFGYRSHGRRRY